MFQQSNQTSQTYSFGIDTYKELGVIEVQQVNRLALRDLWIHHIRNEQEQFDKEDANRHPLTRELKARNFFGH